MAKHHRFWQKDYAHHVGATVQLITCFLAWVFLIIGTPLSVFNIRDKNEYGPNACYTLWGRHNDCKSPDYDWRVDFEQCDAVRIRFQCAEAFSILPIFSLMLQWLFSFYQLGGANYKIFIMLIALLSLGSTTVPWAIVSALYHQNFCGVDTFTHVRNTYGAGFALILTSWCVQCIGFVMFIFFE